MTAVDAPGATERPSVVVARAPFILRAANWVTGLVDRPLRPADLIRAAQRRTGLADFGDRSFETGFETLMQSYEAEADLTPIGRVAARWDTVRYLSNLLLLEAEEKAALRVAETVPAPIFVLGMPRSGTTFMHKLLAEDPEARVVECWETLYPTTGRDGRDGAPEARRKKADALLGGFARLAPEFRAAHPISATSPQECSEVTAHVFASFRFGSTHWVPSYMAWLAGTDQVPAFRFHRRFLGHLQRRKGPGRWVLKCPDHVFSLDAIRSVYPDARFVFMHRDPLEVLASMGRLNEILRRPFTRSIDRARLAAQSSEYWARAAAIMIAEAQRTPAQSGRVMHVTYRRFTADPLGCIAALYAGFGLRLGGIAEARMRRRIAAQPNGGYGRYDKRLEAYALDAATERRRFAAYREKFGV